MSSTALPRQPTSASTALRAAAVCAAALLALAVAMGVGRFAFTPLFPFMVRDGLLGGANGAWLAASNYLGYLLGALLAARLRAPAWLLLVGGLLATLAVTAGMGASAGLPAWLALRFAAGLLSAWTLVATTGWGLAWLAALGRPQLAGVIFAGVGLGIAAVGLFCLVAAGPATSSRGLWLALAGFAALLAVPPLLAAPWLREPPGASAAPAGSAAAAAAAAAAATGPQADGRAARTGRLVFCYALFGFGYILPATYLPAQARQLVDDPHVFGWAWPLFGLAAAGSTLGVAWGLRHANRLRVWAVSHGLMAAGVLLPVLWPALASVGLAALLVGGTFMVVTMVAMQEARESAPGRAAEVLGRMTAGFALGQLLGPLVTVALGATGVGAGAALRAALALAALGLLAGAALLWRDAGRATPTH